VALTADNLDGSRATQRQPLDESKIVGRVVPRQGEAL